MTNLAIRDTLYNIIGGLIVVLFFMFFLVRPLVPEDAEAAQAPGNLMVSIAWPEGNTDIDLWVKTPRDDKAVGYSRRAGLVANLLRDDLGTDGDLAPFNKEDAYTRGLPDGEYVVNAHSYRADKPITVSVEIAIANGGTTRLVFKSSVDLAPKQERTIARFKVRSGEVVRESLTTVHMPLRSAGK